MSNVVAALKAEIVGLEKELSKDPRYQRVEELKRIVGLYEGAPTVRKRVRAKAQSGASTTIATVAQELLRTATEPVPTREILRQLEARGVKVSGEAPHSTLSAILSKSPHFTAHGRSGWTLTVANGSPSPRAPAPGRGARDGENAAPAEPAAVAQDAGAATGEPSEPVAPSA